MKNIQELRVMHLDTIYSVYYAVLPPIAGEGIRADAYICLCVGGGVAGRPSTQTSIVLLAYE